MVSFIYGGNTGETPESVARKREIAAALASRVTGGTPQGWGGGIGAIGDALMYRKLTGNADAAEAKGRGAAAERFAPVLSALGMGGNQQEAANVDAPQPTQQPVAQAPQPASFKDQSRITQQPQHNTLLPPEALQAAGMPAPQPAPQQVAQTQAPQAPQAGGLASISMQQAYEAMSSQWATPEQRKVAGAVFKQKFMQLDPKYQQELMKLERENNPELMRRLKVLEAQALGEVNQGFEIDKEQREQESPLYEANVNKARAQTDLTRTNISKAEREAAEAQTKATRNTTQAKAKSILMTQEVDRAIDLINGGGPAGIGTTGAAAAGSILPGSDARSLSGLLETIKANVGFKELNDMRAASPTGGALGNVTEKELAFLQAVAGKLDQYGDDKVLIDNLNRLRNTAQRVIHDGIPEQELDQMMRELSFERKSPGPGGNKALEDALGKYGRKNGNGRY